MTRPSRTNHRCGGCGRRIIPGRTCPHILGADDEPSITWHALASEARIVSTQQQQYFGRSAREVEAARHFNSTAPNGAPIPREGN